MMKLVIATAMLFAFSAQAQTSQPCGARAAGNLKTEKSYSNLMPHSTGTAAVKASSKTKGTR